MKNNIDNSHIDSMSEVVNSLVDIHEIIWSQADENLEQSICYLILLRVSQINQCGYCVEMHTREARACGESNQRLDQLVVFKQSEHFTHKEKLALEWAEKLTILAPDTDYKPLRESLKKEFSNKNIGLLTTIVGLINLWNRLRISTH